MNSEHELFHAALVSCAYLLVFAAAELWRIFGNPPREHTRKFVHFASGAICLSFSYIFASHWTVLVLCFSFTLVMIVTKRTGLLKSVHDVDRKTSGGMYYPLAVYITFFVAYRFNLPHYYLIAILILAVSDSMAAIIGKRYGFKVYRVEEDNKSLEGSVIFFFVTFLIVLLGLLLLSPLSRAHCIVLAVYLSLLVTAFESISLGGADNIFIPLGAMAVLIKSDGKSVAHIGIHILILIVISLCIYILISRTRKLGISAIIGIALLGYAASALVAPHWVFPVLLGTLLFSFVNVFLEEPARDTDMRRIRPVFYILVVSLIWIFIGNFFREFSFLVYTGYVTNITANLSILWSRKSRLIHEGRCSPIPGPLCHAPLIVRIVVLCGLLVPPTALLDPDISTLFSLVVTIVGMVIIEGVYRVIERKQKGKWRDIQFLQCTALISMIVTLIQLVVSQYFYRSALSLSPVSLLYYIIDTVSRTG